MSDLLPCPFCGARPTLHDTREAIENGGSGDYFWMCDGCGIVTNVYSEEEEAIAAWNRRTPASTVLPDRAPARDTPTSPNAREEALEEVAEHADIALQDALYETVDNGERLWLYDNAKFLASMRGNGYVITRSLSTSSGE